MHPRLPFRSGLLFVVPRAASSSSSWCSYNWSWTYDRDSRSARTAQVLNQSSTSSRLGCIRHSLSRWHSWHSKSSLSAYHFIHWLYAHWLACCKESSRPYSNRLWFTFKFSRLFLSFHLHPYWTYFAAALRGRCRAPDGALMRGLASHHFSSTAMLTQFAW